MKRFWDKVNKTEYCWEWTATIRGNSGYGAIRVGGILHSAHRFSWQLHFGEIPEKMLVCHRCDNRKCIRPDHLFLGSYSDNLKDSFSKGRIHFRKDKIFSEHGTVNRYSRHHCRCLLCKDAHSKALKRWRAKQ